MNGFDSFDTQISAEEYYADERYNTLCRECGREEAVEDGFCSFDCENRWFNAANAETVYQEDAVSYDWDDHMSQWDNDPSPYDGTYSEM